MAATYQHGNIYRGRLSEPLSELFADLLSELTRTRQTALLIAASVALLLSFGLATLGDVDAGVVKLNLNVAESARWIVFAVTGYFFIAYVLGVIGDLLLAGVKGRSAFGSIADVKETIKADVKQRIAAGKVVKEKLIDLQEQHDVVLREWKASVGIYEPTKPLQIGEEIDLVQKYGADKAGPFIDRLLPISKQMNALTDNLPIDDVPAIWSEERELETSLDRYLILKKARLVWDVLCPILYGAFALVWTATHSYVRHAASHG